MRSVGGPGPSWLGEAVQSVVAAALAVVVLPVSWTSVRDGGVATAWGTALIGALVVLHASVATAYRWPVASYAAGGTAMLVLVAGPDLGGPTAQAAGSPYGPVLLPSSLCFFVLLYSVACRSRAPWPTAALAGGLVGCVLTVVRLWGFSGAGLQGWTWWLMLGFASVGGVVAAWALGRFRATRLAWVEQLAERGAAEERRRIAREMHDVVAHSLAVVVGQAEGGRMLVARSPERAPAVLATIADTGRAALTEMRGLLGVLRDDGSGKAPQPGVDDLPDLVDRVREAGLRVEYDAGPPPAVGAGAGLVAYRVVQEALTNVSRHAGAGATARVVVGRVGSDLVVEVRDDGPTARSAAPGGGLTGMRERVEALGGSLEVGPADQGWRVRAVIPS